MFLCYRQDKPHRKYVTRRTRAEVAAELRRLLEAQRRGQLITTGGMTAGEWFAVYLDQVAKPGLRPRTFDRYASDIALHILPAIGRYRLDKLRPAHLAALYNDKAAEGLSPASLRHIHAVIRRSLNVAVRWQVLATNPAVLVDAPQVRQHEVIWLSADEARRLIQAARGDRMQARWLVGLALGLRQGEALGLWWDDIDLEVGLLRVRRALQRQRGGGLVFTDPKTQRSRRTLPLPAPLLAALREHQLRQVQEQIAAGSLWRGSPCVFTTPVGTPIDPRNDYREFKKLLTRASLPSVRLHDLRHTAASLLLAQGVPARVVMEILGHSAIALTMNTYSHVAPEISREAADRMARMLWQDEDQADGGESESGEPMSAVAARVAAWVSLWMSPPVRAAHLTWLLAGGAPGARTLNRRIKSPLLCH
jgi:integrase